MRITDTVMYAITDGEGFIMVYNTLQRAKQVHQYYTDIKPDTKMYIIRTPICWERITP